MERKENIMKKPATVAEVIEVLKKLPPNYPLYTRPKYTGEAEWTTDYPISINGISEMEGTLALEGEIFVKNCKHVCILF